MENKKFYITTPIYYPSDKLHIVAGVVDGSGNVECLVLTHRLILFLS